MINITYSDLAELLSSTKPKVGSLDSELTVKLLKLLKSPKAKRIVINIKDLNVLKTDERELVRIHGMREELVMSYCDTASLRSDYI